MHLTPKTAGRFFDSKYPIPVRREGPLLPNINLVPTCERKNDPLKPEIFRIWPEGQDLAQFPPTVQSYYFHYNKEITSFPKYGMQLNRAPADDDVSLWQRKIDADPLIKDVTKLRQNIDSLLTHLCHDNDASIMWRIEWNIPFVLPVTAEETIYRPPGKTRLSGNQSHGFIEQFRFVGTKATDVQWYYLPRPEVCRLTNLSNHFIMMGAYERAFSNEDMVHQRKVTADYQKALADHIRKYPKQNPEPGNIPSSGRMDTTEKQSPTPSSAASSSRMTVVEQAQYRSTVTPYVPPPPAKGEIVPLPQELPTYRGPTQGSVSGYPPAQHAGSQQITQFPGTSRYPKWMTPEQEAMEHEMLRRRREEQRLEAKYQALSKLDPTPPRSRVFHGNKRPADDQP
ncbi:MAG: hypothetical protein GY740_02475 [Gammaproteobacteria bacterium]|nr:hypothetical protein [Gammaproteobacteria bacterium]